MFKRILCLSGAFFTSWLGAQTNPACNNMGFELTGSGSYTVIPGWQTGQTSYAATNSTINGLCYPYQPTFVTTSDIVTTPYVIPASYSTNWLTPSVVPNSPFGGNRVLELNSAIPYDMNSSTGLVRAEQVFSVTPSNQFLQYAYFISMKASNHPCCASDYYSIELRDCSDNLIPGSTSSATPAWPGNQLCSGTGTLGMSTTSSGVVYTPFWFIKTFNLSPYLGSCVKIVVVAGTCSAGGHSQRIFFDGACSPLAFSGNGLQNGANYVVCDNTTATLTSLPANSYTWTGPGVTGNNQSIVTSTAGVYTLSIGNIGAAPLTQTISLIFGNTPSLSVNSATICPGQLTTLNALGSGISTYSWNTGITTSSIAVSPTASTIYTVVANSATCAGTSTAAVTVLNCAGIKNNLDENGLLTIYPNPSKGSFTVRSDKENFLLIKDLSGRVLKEMDLNANNNYTVQVTGLGSGMYFITSKSLTYKVIVLE